MNRAFFFRNEYRDIAKVGSRFDENKRFETEFAAEC